MTKSIYNKPKVLNHQPITFETRISGPGGGGNTDCDPPLGWDGWEDWFKHHRCFISTACVKAKGLPDDCEELKTLRNFRDTELISTAEGKALVDRYYEIAPKILWKIDQEDNSAAIYHNLYYNLVLKSVELINARKMEEAKNNYMTIVEKLEQKYLSPIVIR